MSDTTAGFTTACRARQAQPLDTVVILTVKPSTLTSGVERGAGGRAGRPHRRRGGLHAGPPPLALRCLPALDSLGLQTEL